MPKAVYSTKCIGIGGQFKRRYADFIVEEIRPSGRVCEVERFASGDFVESNALKVPENKEDKEQLHLDLEKINKDLNFCIRKLARWLQCGKNRIGYAGMKDKRGVTCQRISVFKPDAERFAAFKSNGMELRNPKWEEERIEIGSLKGNQFTIVIRDIALEEKGLEKRINQCFKEIEKNGIANFFGEQRFGGIRKITHLVGKEFVHDRPEKAVMLYLTATCPKESEELSAARKELAKTRDFSKASKEFPVEQRYERSIIHHLCKYPNDFVGAFHNLPKPLRYLFTHAYQSHLFNSVIGERMKQGLGLKKVEGDILLEGLPTAPLYGFESRLAEGKAGEIEKNVLEKEGISLQDFKVKQMPELSSKGRRKEIVLHPKKLKFLGSGEDEFFEGKRTAKLSFELPKGCYATTVLREIMKVE